MRQSLSSFGIHFQFEEIPNVWIFVWSPPSHMTDNPLHTEYKH